MLMHVCKTSKAPWKPDLGYTQEEDDVTWFILSMSSRIQNLFNVARWGAQLCFDVV